MANRWILPSDAYSVVYPTIFFVTLIYRVRISISGEVRRSRGLLPMGLPLLISRTVNKKARVGKSRFHVFRINHFFLHILRQMFSVFCQMFSVFRQMFTCAMLSLKISCKYH